MSKEIVYNMFVSMLSRISVNQLSEFMNGKKTLISIITGGDNSKILYTRKMLAIMGFSKSDFTTVMLLSYLKKTRPDLYAFVLKERNNQDWFDRQIREIRTVLWG